jgi:hypothetical protein
MYGLPADFDPGVLVGTTLDAITFTENTVHLALGDTMSITLQAGFSYRVSSGRPTRCEIVPTKSSELMALAGRRILAASARAGDLRIDLDGGAYIACIEDAAPYESYTIRVGDREIFV